MPIKPARLQEIHLESQRLLENLRQRERVCRRGDTRDEDLLPLDPRRIAEEILGIGFETPAEIPIELRSDLSARQCAGVLDRRGQRILVAAQYFSPEAQRYTGAHEIGHYVLHHGLTLHRERPMVAGDRDVFTRPPIELEADAFAAALLMPSDLMSRCFEARFARSVGPEDATELAFWLSTSSRRLSADMLESDRRYRARMLSEGGGYGGTTFMPLSRMFGVSSEAMAIRLEECDLVL